MAVIRKAQCDICCAEEYERGIGSGWANWMILQGVVLDGVDNPMVCPQCRGPIMDMIDDFKIGVVK